MKNENDAIDPTDADNGTELPESLQPLPEPRTQLQPLNVLETTIANTSL